MTLQRLRRAMPQVPSNMHRRKKPEVYNICLCICSVLIQCPYYAEEWSRIPEDVEILVTHTPPRGILDRTRRGKRAGCPTLAARIESLSTCRLHVFGHIHEAHGANITQRIISEPKKEAHTIDVISVNAACHSTGEKPVIVDLRKDG